MDYELTTQKQKDGSHLVKNKLTNEPVAILTKPKYAYRANAVEAEWHPDFKLLHPEVSDNLLHRNFGKTFDSVSDALNNITNKSESFVRGHGFEVDTIKTKYIGQTQVTNSYGSKRPGHAWHMFDGDEHIGTMTSEADPNTIHRDSPVHMTWNSEYLEKNIIPDSVKEAARKKHPEGDLASSMHRIRYMIDNKQKEPRFIGTTKSTNAELNVFKTKLSPEEASKAYEEHMRNSPAYRDRSFVRHSPVAFMAHSQARGEYGSSYTDHVISLPGEIHHMTATSSHPNYEYGKKNTSIIESAEYQNARQTVSPLLLEDYLFVKSI